MQYKPLSNHLQQRHEHKTVWQKDDDHPNNDWRVEATNTDWYKMQGNDFLEMPEEFKNMSDGHLGQLTKSKLRIELVTQDVRIIANCTLPNRIHCHAVRLTVTSPEAKAIYHRTLYKWVDNRNCLRSKKEWFVPIS